MCNWVRLWLSMLLPAAAVVLGWLAASGFRRASGYIDHYGVLVAIPLLPLVYFLMGSALVFLATGAKYAALTVPGHNTACAMFTNTFTRWWLVCRIVDITNTVFMRHFRGTVLVNWYLNMLVSTARTSSCAASMRKLDLVCMATRLLVASGWPAETIILQGVNQIRSDTDHASSVVLCKCTAAMLCMYSADRLRMHC